MQSLRTSILSIFIVDNGEKMQCAARLRVCSYLYCYVGRPYHSNQDSRLIDPIAMCSPKLTHHTVVGSDFSVPPRGILIEPRHASFRYACAKMQLAFIPGPGGRRDLGPGHVSAGAKEKEGSGNSSAKIGALRAAVYSEVSSSRSVPS